MTYEFEEELLLKSGFIDISKKDCFINFVLLYLEIQVSTDSQPALIVFCSLTFQHFLQSHCDCAVRRWSQKKKPSLKDLIYLLFFQTCKSLWMQSRWVQWEVVFFIFFSWILLSSSSATTYPELCRRRDLLRPPVIYEPSCWTRARTHATVRRSSQSRRENDSCSLSWRGPNHCLYSKSISQHVIN